MGVEEEENGKVQPLAPSLCWPLLGLGKEMLQRSPRLSRTEEATSYTLGRCRESFSTDPPTLGTVLLAFPRPGSPCIRQHPMASEGTGSRGEEVATEGFQLKQYSGKKWLLLGCWQLHQQCGLKPGLWPQ